MALNCWVESATNPDTDFPIENLPYGVFHHHGRVHVGIAIGDQILDLNVCAARGILDELPTALISACADDALNSLMQLGRGATRLLRSLLTQLLGDSSHRARVEPHLIPMSNAIPLLPARIGNYTDFYASLHHATRVGKLFRPDNPLLPNYKYVPIGYHGRASSIIVSGSSVLRPSGQTRPTPAAEPAYGPSRSLDYELEMGMFIGPGNKLGEPIPIADAPRHIFGLCLVNDWSARDVQSWEYQPLGPFLAKSFTTTISPWIVTPEALEPYRIPAEPRPVSDPAPLPYLAQDSPTAFNIRLDVLLETRQMRDARVAPHLISSANLRDLYWTLAQLVTHHASNGCNLLAGDLLATGTISGAGEGSEGCLLEMKHRAHLPELPTGETRAYLEDGDRVVFRAYTTAPGLPRIGFGECSGIILPSRS